LSGVRELVRHHAEELVFIRSFSRSRSCAARSAEFLLRQPARQRLALARVGLGIERRAHAAREREEQAHVLVPERAVRAVHHVDDARRARRDGRRWARRHRYECRWSWRNASLGKRAAAFVNTQSLLVCRTVSHGVPARAKRPSCETVPSTSSGHHHQLVAIETLDGRERHLEQLRQRPHDVLRQVHRAVAEHHREPVELVQAMHE
jgi:hypothetical protein